MLQESTYSMSFYSTADLNSIKYQHLHDKAVKIRDFKNDLSQRICQNPMSIQDLSKFDFLKLFDIQIEGLVGKEIQPALKEVYTCYQNKFTQLNQKISFKIQSKPLKIEYYKKNTKKHKKGDIKNNSISLKSTPLTKVISFLSKYYNETTVDYLIKEIDNINTTKSLEQIEFYKSILYYLNKFGTRLLKLANDRKTRLIKELFSKPILFKELTYDGINNLEYIVSKNKNNHSIIEHFICLSGFGNYIDGKYKKITRDGKLYIPIKYSKKYHGELNDYNLKYQTSYTIQFVKNKIRIILTKKGNRETITDCDSAVGVDTNLKHNLFSLSNGKTIDYNRELIKNYVKFQLKIDKKHDFLYKSNDKDLTEKQIKQKYNLISRKQTWNRRLIAEQNLNVSDLIKETKSDNKDHIICEGLLLKDKTWCRSEEFFGIKYSRLVKMLHLSNVKNILVNQCRNKNIQLTIVPSYYTSQRCSVCGYVDRDNRKTQEDFVCQNCGHSENADLNASKNIKQFKEIDVLSQSFLKLDNSTSWLVPKKLGKQTIKKVLDDYFENNNKYSNDTDINYQLE
jgi:putative transposase